MPRYLTRAVSCLDGWLITINPDQRQCKEILTSDFAKKNLVRGFRAQDVEGNEGWRNEGQI